MACILPKRTDTSRTVVLVGIDNTVGGQRLCCSVHCGGQIKVAPRTIPVTGAISREQVESLASEVRRSMSSSGSLVDMEIRNGERYDPTHKGNFRCTRLDCQSLAVFGQAVRILESVVQPVS